MNKNRQRPGAGGGGKFYRIEIRPKTNFVTFRYQDVGKPSGIERLAGKRKSGRWADQAWLIEKNMAHIEDDQLVADNPDAKDVLNLIGPVTHLRGDIFKGHPHK